MGNSKKGTIFLLAISLLVISMFNLNVMAVTSPSVSIRTEVVAAETNTYKMIIHAAPSVIENKVKFINVVISYDNTLIIPVANYDTSMDVSITTGSDSVDPFEILAQYRTGALFQTQAVEWYVDSARNKTAFAQVVSTTQTSSFTKAGEQDMFAFYFRLANGKNADDLAKGSIKIEIDKSEGSILSSIYADVRERNAIYLIESTGTEYFYPETSGKGVVTLDSFTYPNCTVAALGSITLSTLLNVTAVNIPGNTVNTPNTLTLSATALDTEGDLYTLVSGTWSLVGDYPSGVTLTPDTLDGSKAVLSVPAGTSTGTATVKFASGSVEASKTITIQKSASIPTHVNILDGAAIAADVTMNKPLTSGGAATEKAFTAKTYDQYGVTQGNVDTWSVSPADKGVSVAAGTVIVTPNAEVGAYTLTATSGSLIDTIQVTVGTGVTGINITGDSSVIIPASKDGTGASVTGGNTLQLTRGIVPSSIVDYDTAWTVKYYSNAACTEGEALTATGVGFDTETGAFTVDQTATPVWAKVRLTLNADTTQYSEKVIAVNRAASVVTYISLAADNQTIIVPTLLEVAIEKNISVAIYDQYGGLISSDVSQVTWTNLTSVTGVTLNGTGKIKVQPASAEGTLTVKVISVSVPSVTKALDFNIERSNSTAAIIKIKRGDIEVAYTGGSENKDLIVIPVSGAADILYQYSALVYDQYGDMISNPIITWTNTAQPTEVLVNNSDVTLKSNSSTGNFTLTATVDPINISVVISVTDVVVDWNEIDSRINKETIYTYGDTNGKVTLPTSGSATAGSNNIPGGFSYKEPLIKQAAGDRIITVVFTATENPSIKIEHVCNVVINPKPITVIAENKTKVYGQLNPNLTFTVNDADLVDDDTKDTLAAGLSLSYVPSADYSAGAVVAINGQDSNSSDNYAITVTSGSLTIHKADISSIITANPALGILANHASNTTLDALKSLLPANVDIVFGTDNTATLPITWAYPANTVFNVKGTVYTLNGTVTPGTNFNAYTSPYTASITVTPVRGTLTTVLPLSVTVAQATANAADAYDDFGLPTSLSFSFDQSVTAATYTDLLWDKTVSTLKAIPVESQTVITMVQGNGTGNVPTWITLTSPVAITVKVTAKLVIPEASISLTPAEITYGDNYTPAASLTGSYGDTTPAVTYSYQNASGTALTAQPSNAGSYYVTATYENATHKGSKQVSLTINAKPIRVIIDDQTKEYKQVNPSLTWSIDPSTPLAFNEMNTVLQIVMTCSANTTSPAGIPVPITGTWNNANYAVTFQGKTAGTTGILTITKASITTLTPVVNGTAAVNYVLTAALTGVADNELTWQWYRAENVISGATGKTYTLVAADSNQAITVKAVAVELNYSGTSGRSAAKQIDKMTAAGTVILTETNKSGGTPGSIEVGDTLNAVISNLVPAEATQFTYQWKKNGAAISGANNAAYTIATADATGLLAVEVTVTGNYQGVFTSNTLEVGKILLDGTVAFTANSGADINQLVVGNLLTMTVATTATLNTDYGIQWLRDGAAIANAVGNTYTITTADPGKNISVKLIGSGTYAGEIVSAATLVPAVVPFAPSVSVYPSDATATISWSEPANGGYPIVSYVIQKNAESVIMIPAAQRSYTFNGLTNGSAYTFKVFAINALGAGATATATTTPVAPEEEIIVPPVKPPVTPPVENPIVVVVNGQDRPVGALTTEATPAGGTEQTITINDTQMNTVLTDTANGATITLPFTEPANAYISTLNGQTVSNMEQREAVLEIRTETVTYTLPASEINIDRISEQLGQQVDLKDIQVSISIAEPSAETTRIVEDTANRNHYSVIVQPVDFEITCTSGTTTVDVSHFNAYVERMIAIPDGIDPAKITTGVVLNSDGTFSHVPTSIVLIDGKYYARINSLTNSTYAVIYSPVSFADTAGHWAVDAIQNMGSRLIVCGTGDGNYEPGRAITRAEFVAILVRALGLQRAAGVTNFPDVANTAWFAGSVQTAVQYGLVAGYDDGRFGPFDNITREQAMTMIARAMKLTQLKADFSTEEIAAVLAGFSDAGETFDYAKAGIAACVKNGLVAGRSAAVLAPKANITRAEVAVIIEKLLQESNLI
ncbi:MAG: S-layer homology domain-containing protein [Negativicutes bacterium]|nr:S-layer homology domain-containing protein [Negativicutes bacterium]